MAKLTHRFLTSIDQCSDIDWNSLLVGDNPFNRHQWFAALEHSGATTADTGWQPFHLLVEENGSPALIIPSFIKAHSYGEYVFDWAWADAYQRYGLEYYPKLISAVPFTPCYGPRFLGSDDLEVHAYALEAIKNECESRDLSGWHCLFPSREISEQLREQGLGQRTACQFHWFNRDYQSFDDFVASFSSRKRKNVLKERRRVREQGFSFRTVSGAGISADDWAFFYQMYARTYLKRSGHTGYLNEEFFALLGQHLSEQCVMVIAYLESQPVAASLLLRDSRTLYGRYWGSLAEFDFLHFETCYYQGIDYAIAEGLQRFDGGAQGEHKLARGFEPVLTYSNHWLADERFDEAIVDFLEQEAAMVAAYQQGAQAHLPFRNTGD
ncbi:GNAT family N-acetyltransferase [Gilvimarinus sp. HB14]|uniref:GNAT family N-acetyltransferase n=1 Tax=Gilvimarinus xylanilyticus TaxID=2944139 RepID=A0A9X2I6I5_9GAMM|nr:GNAT family N-acetyltransferase [Gilvimarinus xylanilyticus]MCP8900337.1 GNAT family N-acetyltransferase [Gilvimarinus xylanilyticus]